MKIEYFIIKDLELDGRARSVEELGADPTLRQERLRDHYCHTSLCAGDGQVYCGCTNPVGFDILHEFEIATGRFRSLNFAKVAEPYDAKIHRGLAYDRARHSLYFGIATLTPTSKIALSQGARIMRFDLKHQTYHELGRPAPGNYIQATVYDADRQLMYSFYEPTEGFAVSELATGRTRRAIPTGRIVHNSTIDQDGGVWATWGFRGTYPFYRYDPDTDTFEFFEDLVMPTSAQACDLMYPGAGPIDCLRLGPDNRLYIASAMGELYRIDTRARQLEYLGRPIPHNRTPGLCFGADGLLYGIGGTDWKVMLWSFDRQTGRFHILGHVKAPDGRTCFRPHDMIFHDGHLYAGETDNPKNSGCLWKITL